MVLASAGALQNMVLQVHWWEWLILAIVTVSAIGIDALANRDHRAPTFKKALRLVVMFVVLGALYGGFVIFMHGGDAGVLYYSAWGIEYSLSIDNVFMWVVILDTFKIPAKYRHKLLFLGVFGALVFRLVFILLGSVLIGKAGAVFIPILAVVVGYSAWKVYTDDTEAEIEESGAYKLANKILPIKPGRQYGGKFFVRERVERLKDGILRVSVKIYVTYLLVAVAVIELIDVLFAFDSVPAALAITTNSYLVFASNAMAILGLRALFFVIGPLKDRLTWLNEGLAVILGWVAIKLLLSWEFTIAGYHHEALWHPPVWLSLAIIGFCLTVAGVASKYWPKQEGNKAEETESIHDNMVFNATLIVHGGESYRDEVSSGLLWGVYNDTLRAIGSYDTDGIVPVWIAREQPQQLLSESISHGTASLPDVLGTQAFYGEVNLAAAIRAALRELPANQPALITVISDFQIADQEALIALVDELAASSRQVFLKLVFATGDADGNHELPQLLDDRHTGSRDKVDAVYATHFHGDPNESVREHFGREVDVLVRMIHRTRRGDTPESLPVG